jgi:hypothetical protein
VWHLNSLKVILQKQLMTASAKALKVALHFPDPMISYASLHKMANRATPEFFLKYKMSLLLYRTLNNEISETDWLSLNFDQIITSRQNVFIYLLRIVAIFHAYTFCRLAYLRGLGPLW